MSTKIEWATKVWNPVTGCDKVSAGCENCYAIGMTNRLQKIDATKKKYAGSVKHTKGGNLNWTGNIQCHESELETPSKWKKPQRVFVCSMSDLFHEDIPFDFIEDVFDTMRFEADQHTYLVLTKRPDRAIEFYSWAAIDHPIFHIWIGTSVENQEQANKRIPHLLQIPAAVRFLSCEPLLGKIDLNMVDQFKQFWMPQNDGIEGCAHINWVIAGGESGHNARPMHPDWVRSLRDQCQDANVPFFFKQWGEWHPTDQVLEKVVNNRIFPTGDSHKWDERDEIILNKMDEGNVWKKNKSIITAKVGKKAAGRMLDGREWNELPRKEVEQC